jgi:PAS domain S-box-containing protein
MSLMIPNYVVDLRRGIEGGEIVPYFQPLIELRTGKLIGLEVLSRWKHPLRGMVPPDEFIRMAEDAGCIGELMERVLLLAFETLRRLPEYLRISINVSAIQLRDRTLRQQVSDAARAAGFALNRLTIEITETALVGNIEHARAVTEELKALGVRIALDDFGTGYSSLRHLHAIPFDEIKVDRSFVQTMLSRRESRKIVAAIIGLGQSLGMTTVAEGVEDVDQADMLLWLGCDVGQGFLYGRPVSAGRLERYVLDQKIAVLRDRGKSPNSNARSEDTTYHSDALPSQRLSQLQAIYDGAPVGLCFVDRNERYVSLNKRLAELNNEPIVAHLGRTVVEVIPNFYKSLEPYIKRALNGEAFSGLVFQARRNDGLLQVRSTSYQPTRDEAGEVVGISVAVVDITDQENTQEALRESENHHRYAMESNPQVPWMADPDGLIVEASPRWTALTGLSNRASKGEGWLKMVHPEDVVAITDTWKHCLITKEPLDAEYRVQTHSGDWRWVRVRASARRDVNGDVIRWYGLLEDIHDYKLTEVQLALCSAQLKTVFNTVPLGMVLVAVPHGRIVMTNPPADLILHDSASPQTLTEETERSTDDWCVLFDKAGLRVTAEKNPLLLAIQQGETSTAEEFVYHRADRSRVLISLTAAPVLGPDDTIIGGLLTLRDLEAKNNA